MSKIAVIVGATREGRVTDKLAGWVAKEIEKQNGEVEVLDLVDYPMPFLDEMSPRFNPDRKTDAVTDKWIKKIAEFDGYVLVTPEYNRSTSAVLKNAIDVLGHEMDDKPVALVGHGTTGGAQAIANLRMALPGIGAVTVPQALFFSDRVGEAIDDKGMLDAELEAEPYGPATVLKMLVQSLTWYTEALKAARK